MSTLIFDKYEIKSRLAVGGMGEVFYAVQVQKGVRGFERPVILKNLLPELAQQEGFIEQFLDEARVAATLNHPNVVSIYEVGLWNGMYYIAMEYIRGRNIAQILKQSIRLQTPVPPQVAARIVHDAATGLDHAHTAVDASGRPLNIVHRDVSPQNIMVRDDGVTKVVDFGIARASNRATRTVTGALKGKLAYMSPEQALGKDVNGLSDQFSLGIVLWETLAGRRLFSAEQEVELIQQVVEQPIVPPSRYVAGLPEELDEIARRMLQRDPSARFMSCAEVARSLAGYLQKVSLPASESPVGAYMRRLGFEDLSPTRSGLDGEQKKNFVIQLNKDNASSSQPIPQASPPAGVFTAPDRPRAGKGKGDRRPSSVDQALAVPLPERRWLVALGVVVGVAAAAAYVAYDSETPAVDQPTSTVATATVEPTPPPVVPVPSVDPSTVPATGPGVATALRPGRMDVVTEPEGVNVRFDGRPVGPTPLTLNDVLAGVEHYVSLEKPGYERVDTALTLTDGEFRHLSFELKPIRTAPREPRPTEVSTPQVTEPGLLTLETKPWTKVSIGDESLGSTPIYKRKIPAGRVVLQLVNEEEHIRVNRAVDIRSGETTKLSLTLK